jgi:hypothetical protein
MSRVSDLSYDIEQLYIEGYSPRTISVILECPLELVLAWLEETNVEDFEHDELVDNQLI